MILLFILLLSLVITLARGGSLNALLNLNVRYLWLFFVPLLMQLVLFTPLVTFFGSSTTLVQVAYFVSMLVGALVLLLNRRIPGLAWIAVGLALNLLVITANGGFMPVSAAARAFAGQPPLTGNYNNVIPMTSGTLLWFLGDILPLPAWVPLTNVFSLGDVFITLGGVLFIQRTLMGSRTILNPQS